KAYEDQTCLLWLQGKEKRRHCHEIQTELRRQTARRSKAQKERRSPKSKTGKTRGEPREPRAQRSRRPAGHRRKRRRITIPISRLIWTRQIDDPAKQSFSLPPPLQGFF